MTIAVLFLLAAQQFPTNPPQIRRDPNAEIAAVVRAVINEFVNVRFDAPEHHYIVVADQTLMSCPAESHAAATCIFPPIPDVEFLSEDLQDRMRDASRQSVKLPPPHDAGAHVVPSDELTEILKKGGWDEFYRRLPRSKGYLRVTKPAFSNNRKNALIYVSYFCGFVCGDGWLMSLSHASGTWEITNRWNLWVS
jgi:hypothetical protein